MSTELPPPVQAIVDVVSAQVGGNGFNGPSHFAFDTAGRLVSRMTIRQ